MQRMVDPTGAVSDDRIRRVHIRLLLGDWDSRQLEEDHSTLTKDLLKQANYVLDRLPGWCSDGLLDDLLLDTTFLAKPEKEEANMVAVINRLNNRAGGPAHSANFGTDGKRLEEPLQMLIDDVRKNPFPEPSAPVLVPTPAGEPN